jgi:LacI family transcriptional regulator
MLKKTKKKNVNLKTIANDLGVSFSTVSKSLNNSPGVKEETRQIVLKRASELGYAPNMLARGLRTGSTKTIGVILNDIENPVLAYIFRCISVQMAEYGYTTMLCDSQFDQRQERSNILSVLAREPDFVIIAPAVTSTANLDLLLDNTKKVIILGNSNLGYPCNFIDVDYKYGGYLSACELLSNGHREILTITEPLDYPFSSQYLEGIKKAYEEYQVPFNTHLLKFAHASVENSKSLILSLYDRKTKTFPEPFTGVIAFDDHLAHGVYSAMALLGYSIPEDISIVGFDDNPLSEFSAPALTTIHLPKEHVAEKCIEILRNTLIEKKDTTACHSLLPYLVKRDSVKNNY